MRPSIAAGRGAQNAMHPSIRAEWRHAWPDLTRSSQIWTRSGSIWPDLARSGPTWSRAKCRVTRCFECFRVGGTRASAVFVRNTRQSTHFSPEGSFCFVFGRFCGVGLKNRGRPRAEWCHAWANSSLFTETYTFTPGFPSLSHARWARAPRADAGLRKHRETRWKPAGFSQK